MNESGKNNGGNALMKNLGAIFFLISIVVVALAYQMVYKDYNTKTDDMKREIDSLKSRRDELRELDNGKSEIQARKEKAESDREEILEMYDGKLSYDGQIMDTYNIMVKEEILVPRLSLSLIEEPYIFGELASSNPNETSTAITNDYLTESMTFSITANGSYEQIKNTLRDLIGIEGKRKVLQSIDISFDDAKQRLILDASLVEYAIIGEDRDVLDVVIPDYDQSRNNIFYDSDNVISEQ